MSSYPNNPPYTSLPTISDVAGVQSTTSSSVLNGVASQQPENHYQHQQHQYPVERELRETTNTNGYQNYDSRSAGSNGTGTGAEQLPAFQDGFNGVSQGQPQQQPLRDIQNDASRRDEHAESEKQKTNRLRKACDSCSVRKVKVRMLSQG